jgi:hypothetical protein
MPPENEQKTDRSNVPRRSFATANLLESKVRAIAKARMDQRHDHLNRLLDPK